MRRHVRQEKRAPEGAQGTRRGRTNRREEFRERSVALSSIASFTFICRRMWNTFIRYVQYRATDADIPANRDCFWSTQAMM
jgi:hypothetical protein